MLKNNPFINKIEYISNLSNLGIAVAQNIACKMAYENGFEWVILMDQDSRFESDFRLYLNNAERFYNNNKKIAIFTPNIYPYNKDTLFVSEAISSGSIVNLKVWKQCGGFLEKLFIDEVDTEFCWRIRKYGYLICRLNQIKMNHCIGNPFNIQILGKQCLVQNHSYIRTYYVIRNRLYMIHHYFSVQLFLKYTKYNLRDLFYIIFFEKDKERKLQYFFRGIKDFLKNKYG